MIGAGSLFYYRLIFDQPLYTSNELLIDLELFAYSVMHTLYCLCELSSVEASILMALLITVQAMTRYWMADGMMDDACQFYDELTDLLMRYSIQ
jgi:hypothetical protein